MKPKTAQWVRYAEEDWQVASALAKVAAPAQIAEGRRERSVPLAERRGGGYN